MRFFWMVLIALSFSLGGGFSAQAKNRLEEQCEYKLVKAARQHASCLLRARNVRPGKGSGKNIEPKIIRCEERYTDQYEAALARFGEKACTTATAEALSGYIDHVTHMIHSASSLGGEVPEIRESKPVFGFSTTNPKKTGASQYLSLVADLENFYGQTYSNSETNPVVPNDECFGDRACSVAGKTNWGMVSATPGVTHSLDGESWPAVLTWMNSLHESRSEPLTVAIYIGLPSEGLTPSAWGDGDPGSTSLEAGVSLALWIEYPTNKPTVSEYNNYLASLASFVKKNPAITDVVLSIQDPALYPEFDPANLKGAVSGFPSGVDLHALPYISTDGGGWCSSPGSAGSFCSTQNGCADLGKPCSGSDFSARLASYQDQATPSGCSNSLEVSGAWLAEVPRFSGLTYDLEAGGCWALASKAGQPAPDDKQAFLEGLLEYVADSTLSSNSEVEASLPPGTDACTCYESSDAGVANCFGGKYAACKAIYLPVFNYSKQACNPDSVFWENIKNNRGSRDVYGMVNVPNGSLASSVDWSVVEKCVSDHSDVLSGIFVDLEKTSTANCALSAAEISSLNAIPEVRLATSSSGTCDGKWASQGVAVVSDFMCYDGNEKLTSCKTCPVVGSNRYMFGEGSYSGTTVPSAACQASGAPLDYYFQ